VISKSIRKLILGISGIVCVGSMLPVVANAAAEWQHFGMNFFGFGGDFGEVVRVTAASSEQHDRWFRFAVSKSYQLRSNAWIFIKQDHNAVMRFSFRESKGNFSAFAYMERGNFSNVNLNSNLLRNTFLSTQALIRCGGISFRGPMMLNNEWAVISSVDATCPNGAIPDSGQAQFYHGVGNERDIDNF